MTHRIRLRGPWALIPIRGDDFASQMSIPGSLRDSGLQGYVGRLQFARTFHKPTNLEEHEAVWIVFDGVVGSAEVFLNDERLGSVDRQARFSVKDLLTKVNDLSVVVDVTDDSCGIVGDVALEIVSNPQPTSPASQSSR